MSISIQEKIELVNAARSYERIVAERREMFVSAIGHKKDGQKEAWMISKSAYWDSKERAKQAEKLVAERIYGEHDFVRVDDVIYMAYSPETLLRIPLKDVTDLREINTRD